MPGRGVFGPYPAGNKWRLLIREASGDPGEAQSYATKEEAERDKRLWQEELNASEVTTIKEAIETYEEYLKEKNESTASHKETPRRLRWFFKDNIDDAVEVLSGSKGERLCERTYEKLKRSTYEKGGEVRAYSVATCKNTLAEAKTFLNWCVVKKKWLKENTLLQVKDERERSHGKPQPTHDEARIFDAAAIELAEKGDDRAVAALMTMVMGLRASEITRRVVRDLDDDGKVLITKRAKTKAGNRRTQVPEYLQPFLRKLCEGKQPDDLIFPTPEGREHYRDWPRECVQRICKKAGITVVTAHGMRGFNASTAIEEGVAPHYVARSLGHESATTTMTSYATPEAAQAARQAATLTVLNGGKGRKGHPAQRP